MIEIPTAADAENPKSYFLQNLDNGFSGNINEITPGMDSEYPDDANWIWMAAYNPNIFENYLVAGWASDLCKAKLLTVKAIGKIKNMYDELSEDIENAKMNA